MLTYEQIKDEIRSHFADRTDIESRLNTVIDLSVMRIARMHDWDSLKYTFFDNFTITTPDTAASRRKDRIISLIPTGDSFTTNTYDYRIRSVYLIKVRDSASGRNRKLDGYTVSEFDSRHPDPDYNDRNFPIEYTWFADRDDMSTQVNQFVASVWPAPDAAYEYEIRLNLFPRMLNGTKVDTDRCDIHNVDDAIISLTVSTLYASQGREDKSNKYFGIFSSQIREVLKLDEEDFHQVVAGVHVSRSFSGSGEYWRDPFVRFAR